MAWSVAGSIKGPKGDQGIQGVKGATGATGPAGQGIEISGSVATYADLPTGLGTADAGHAYEVTADGKLYVWSGTQFPADGQGSDFRGPQGDTGPANSLSIGTVENGVTPDATITGTPPSQTLNLTLERGPAGATGGTGDKGDKGSQGVQGVPGDPGVRGSKWFTGSGAPSGISGALDGDMYLDTSTGEVYQF